MIGFLRFFGILNIAAWFGTAFFFTFIGGWAASSQEMRELLGTSNYPYFSGAISHIFFKFYFYLQLGCAVIAMLHLLAEWLYLGKAPRQASLALLLGVLFLNLLSAVWLQPKLKNLRLTQYGGGVRAERRESAGRAFGTWHSVSQFIDLVTVAGLGVYLWRSVNAAESARFVSAAKFRG